MAAMVHFYRFTPDTYWGMDARDVQALVRYRDKWIQAQNKK